MYLIWFLLIGLIAGWLAGMIVRGAHLGLLGNLVVGVIGALLGGFLFRLVGLGPTSLLGQLIAATVGAVLLLAILPRVTGRRRY